MSTPYDPAGAVSALEDAQKRIDELEQKLAALAAPASGSDVPHLTAPTHDLYLVDGTHVEHTGAIPTEVSFPDRPPVPVAAAVAR